MKITIRTIDEEVIVSPTHDRPALLGVIVGVTQTTRAYKTRNGKVISTLEVLYTVRFADDDQEIHSENDFAKKGVTMNQYIAYDTSNDNFITALCNADNEEEAKAKFLSSDEFEAEDFDKGQFEIEQSFITIL